MKLRSAAVVAGLALGLMLGTAQAATVTYNLDYLVNGILVGGVIETNGASGLLTSGDLVSETFTSQGQTINSAQILTSGNTGIYAFQNTLGFYYGGNGKIDFLDSSGLIADEVGFSSSGSGAGTFQFFAYNVEYGKAGFEVLGTSTVSVGGQSPLVPTVPLPASAPMFGAALLTLGAVGYRVKRKKAAAAA